MTVEGRNVPEVERLAAASGGDAAPQLMDVPGLRTCVAALASDSQL